jgi:hypothetical protein
MVVMIRRPEVAISIVKIATWTENVIAAVKRGLLRTSVSP